MCGIFGVVAQPGSGLSSKVVSELVRSLGSVSMYRGRDSSGILFKDTKNCTFLVIKGGIPIDRLFESAVYKEASLEAEARFSAGHDFVVGGHARLVTNGSQLRQENNQPVVKDGLLGLHNGIVVNDNAIWDQYPEMHRNYMIDTEVILSLFRLYLKETGDLISAASEILRVAKGSVSAALLFEENDEWVLFTNTGSLYYYLSKGLFIFASEKSFLESLRSDFSLPAADIRQISAGSGIIFQASHCTATSFNVFNGERFPFFPQHQPYSIKTEAVKGNATTEMIVESSKFLKEESVQYRSLLEYNWDRISKLKRCSKCILPETFPFITFDHNSVCNYCLNYKVKRPERTIADLEKLVAPFRRTDGRPDCIVPFSGGRDSTYTLHMIKTHLKMNPITYTYDWGMVTDLARRNIARVCGKLGVENIIVAADIREKRSFIKKNIEAWLKKPELGMVPLFMSGDKSFHYYLTKIQKKTGISLNIWGENYLEKTDFKVGFAGVAPQFDKSRIYSLSIAGLIRMGFYLTKSVVQNPRYLNASVIDNIQSQYSRTFMPKKDYYNFYDYFAWDEKTINDTISSEYGWEMAIDTNSTWRIGDGTSAFYNYIYFTVAGFTEFDTFRSNQIREGMLDRAEALSLVEQENKARYETLRWYLEILELDFTSVISKVNQIPKLY